VTDSHPRMCHKETVPLQPSWRAWRHLVLLVLTGLASCASTPSDERLHSTLWVQTSAEYGVITHQVFHMARQALEQSLLSAPAGPAPALIIDVDETVLDNSGQTARSILARTGFRRDAWRAWVNEASAPAVPGALEYLRHADQRGVTVFYVTNRSVELEPATRSNLDSLGFPLRSDMDVILTRNERPEWTRDKTTRRQWVAARFQVLQILGDDLGDFVAVPPGTDAEVRQQLAAGHTDEWGRRWFMLPNPIYGSWERALTPDGTTIFDSPMEQKFKQLETQ